MIFIFRRTVRRCRDIHDAFTSREARAILYSFLARPSVAGDGAVGLVGSITGTSSGVCPGSS
jgi:hypothetical protein